MEPLGVKERIFSYAGLNTPTQRGLAGIVVTTGLLFATKPDALFDRLGTPRPWKFFDENGSWVVWWMIPLAVGGALSIFI